MSRKAAEKAAIRSRSDTYVQGLLKGQVQVALNLKPTQKTRAWGALLLHGMGRAWRDMEGIAMADMHAMLPVQPCAAEKAQRQLVK